MPRRVETFKPPWVVSRRRQQAAEARPTAAKRGYCSASWRRTRLAVIARDQGICQICGGIVDKYAQIDHIVPKAEGGSDAMSNLRLLCHPCHSRRTATESR